MLDRVQAKRMITFLDSCYSAATVNLPSKTRSLQTEIPWKNFTGAGRVIISASDGKQLSLELEEYQHGVFTYYLLEGLRGGADKKGNGDFWVDVGEIWDYVKTEVTDAARRVGNPQTPVFQADYSGEIPLTFLWKEHKDWSRVALACERWERLKAQKQAERDEKREKLKKLFVQGKIQPQHFNCAFKMLEIRFKISGQFFTTLRSQEGPPLPENILKKLEKLQNRLSPTEEEFKVALTGTLGPDDTEQYHCLIMIYALTSDPFVEGLLSGAISPEVFESVFQCDAL
jgi:hypothetical protein